MSDASSGNTPVNIASLAGRSDGPSADLYALIEYRNSALDIEQEVWVNGFRVGFFESPDKAGGESMSYCLVGKRDLNLSGKGHRVKMWAVGNPDDFGQEMTKAQATTLRAKILADFGIAVWDGSTYPS